MADRTSTAYLKCRRFCAVTSEQDEDRFEAVYDSMLSVMTDTWGIPKSMGNGAFVFLLMRLCAWGFDESGGSGDAAGIPNGYVNEGIALRAALGDD